MLLCAEEHEGICLVKWENIASQNNHMGWGDVKWDCESEEGVQWGCCRLYPFILLDGIIIKH